LVRDGTGRCVKHPKKAFRKASNAQATTTQRGYGWSWQKLRIGVLKRDRELCQVCERQGIVALATEVDHIVPKELGGTDDPENLQAICEQCHREKTQIEAAHGSRPVAFFPEWLPAPSVPVTVVCGPPGSGKTTYVAERAKPSELVIDLDVIAAKAFGLPLYHASSEQLMSAVRARNLMLASLRGGHRYSAAWLIVSGERDEHRAFWRAKYGALVVMETPLDECARRVRLDGRRPPEARDRALLAIRQWGEGRVKSLEAPRS
jgi:5-methylcytosine-specific restriction protein A